VARVIEREHGRLRELALLFARLGVTAFGGPAAHIAMMEDEIVRRRGWLSSEEFLDLVGATNLIPGPNSTEVAIHVGHKRAGFPGLVVAGVAFIVPAVILTLGFAWLYVRFGAVPQARGVLYGVKPVIIAVIAQALFALGKTALKTRAAAFVGVLAAAAAFVRVQELVVLFGAGCLMMLIVSPREKDQAAAFALAAGSAGAQAAPVSSVFLVFAKIGSVLFGSGYVLVAFLRADLVQRRHWISEAQLVDAVAVGQLTPGPVSSTATFVGYLIDGLPGAAAATLGIFLPAFVFVALSRLVIPKIRGSTHAGAFLDGVNVASLALMAVVAIDLGRASLVDVPALGLAVTSALLLFYLRVSSAWLVAGGAIAGTLIQLAPV
jgi:chromate transporter